MKRQNIYQQQNHSKNKHFLFQYLHLFEMQGAASENNQNVICRLFSRAALSFADDQIKY